MPDLRWNEDEHNAEESDTTEDNSPADAGEQQTAESSPSSV